MQLYDVFNPSGPTLPIDAALAAIADDRNWFPAADVPTGESAWALVTTTSGEEEYRRQHALQNY